MNYLKTHILVVEDNLQDFIIFKEVLGQVRDFFVQIDHADSLESALAKLKTTAYDLIFLDLFLPDSYGQETFSAVSTNTNSAIIILSGLSDKTIALDIVKQGAQDYIVKGDFNASLLEKSVVYSIERRKYQEILEESERRNRTIFESVGIAIAEYDYSELNSYVQETKQAGKALNDLLKDLDQDRIKAIRKRMAVLNMNPEALSLYNCTTKQEFEAKYEAYYNEDFVSYYKQALTALWNEDDEMVYELPFVAGNGTVIHTLKRWRFLGRQSGFYRLLISTEDVSELKANQTRIYRQSTVMELVAQAASYLLQEGPIEDKLNKVLSSTGEALGGDQMAVYRLEGDAGTSAVSYHAVAHWEVRKGELDITGFKGLIDDGPTLMVIEALDEGRIQVVNKNSDVPLVRELLERHQVEQAVIAPFLMNEARGCLILGYRYEGLTADYVFAALATLASTIGAALATWSAQQKLQKMNEELEQMVNDRTRKMRQAIKELESFSYSVSHDLRAPLRTISGFTGVLHESYNEVLDDEGKHFLNNIRKGAHEMSLLIDDLLNFSRMGRKKLNFLEIDMAALVKEICLELSAQVPERNIQFDLGELLPCCGDRSMIRQVMVNLIWNAVKFTGREEEAKIQVHSLALENGFVQYRVKDNGVGFDMAYADKLFGVFQRLHAHEEFDGTGVGLAIIQRIVTRHGGEVKAYGEENKGAEFTFTLQGLNEGTPCVDQSAEAQLD